VAVGQAQKKKENPYLAHRTVLPKSEVAESGGSTVLSAPPAPVDERIKTSNRDVRAKRTFNFVEAGANCQFRCRPSMILCYCFRNLCEAS
jgi:hypothetical protein